MTDPNEPDDLNEPNLTKRRSTRMRTVPNTLLHAMAVGMLASCHLPMTQLADPQPVPEHSLSLLVGQREYDEDLWAPLESPTSIGVQFTRGRSDHDWAFEAGAHYTEDSGSVYAFLPGRPLVDISMEVLEVSMGARWSPRLGHLRPYIGGGLSYQTGSVEANYRGYTSSEDDSTPGMYIHAGATYALTDRLDVGIDIRAVGGTSVGDGSEDGDLDYTQASFTMGWRF